MLWSCTTCGACVEQCPVDIEHIDHIVDMRRYQVLIESAFPAELGGLFKNLENKGNPWGLNASQRAWTGPSELDFEVRARSRTTIPDDVEYLFWVGCAGAYEDRAKKTTQAVAELLHLAGRRVRGARRGRDLHRRLRRAGSGNEFLFQMLAQQNVETLNDRRREEDRRHLRALLQHAGQRVPAARRQLRGACTTPQLLNRLVARRAS